MSKARAHYQAVKDLIGEEDLAFLKAFFDFAMANLEIDKDGNLLDADGSAASEEIDQGVGLIMDILDPSGIDT